LVSFFTLIFSSNKLFANRSINSLHPSSNTLLSFTSFYVASIRMYFSLDRLRDLNKDIDDGRDKKRCAYISDSDKHKPWQAVNVINELLSLVLRIVYHSQDAFWRCNCDIDKVQFQELLLILEFKVFLPFCYFYGW